MKRMVRTTIVAAIALTSALIGVADQVAPWRAAAEAATATSRYEPLLPCRLADQRRNVGFENISGNYASIGVDACEIPTTATSIAVTITVVNPQQGGWLVTYPAGQQPPTAATLNWSPGATRANTTVVPVGAGRRIGMFRHDGFAAAAVVVDVIGAFVPATSATAGRFVSLPSAQRILDTRTGIGRPAGADSTTRVNLPDGVPADATALAINLTVVRTTRGGFFTVHPAGSSRPEASVLNADHPGQFRAAATFVPVTEGGFDLYTESGAHMIVDVTGWFTGDSAPAAGDGLFVSVTPERLRDTRPEVHPIHPNGTIEVRLPGHAAGAGAAVISMAMVRPGERGYITASPARTQRGETSSGYGMAGEVSAQFAVSPVSAAGVDIYAETGTDLTVDLVGWFTGTPTPTRRSTASPNRVERQRVITIGDSTLAGIDRNRSWAQLRGADFALMASSCRRLFEPSCRGRNAVPSPTTFEVLRAAPYGWYDVAVIMTGYNDQMPQFSWSVPNVIQAARDAGIRRIIWMTHAREFRSDKGGANAFQVYGPHNGVIRSNAAASYDVQAVEWGNVVRQAPNWVYSDGIHLDRPGGSGAADFISRAVAHVTGQSCPVPQFPGGSTAGRCPDPGGLPPVDVTALYGIPA